MSLNKLNIAVAGATGYVGLDLIFYLSKHPNVKISYLCAQKKIGNNIQQFDKRIKKKLPKISNLKKLMFFIYLFLMDKRRKLLNNFLNIII